MPKWIPEECGKIVDDTSAFLGRANSDADAAGFCDSHNAERDRLAAENAELRNGILPSQVHAHSHYQQVKRQRDAATAQLGALREAVPEGDGNYEDLTLQTACVWLREIHAILYPAPSIRNTAARHGFAPMPPEMGQQTLDGETNYVAMPPETPNDNT